MSNATCKMATGSKWGKGEERAANRRIRTAVSVSSLSRSRQQRSPRTWSRSPSTRPRGPLDDCVASPLRGDTAPRNPEEAIEVTSPSTTEKRDPGCKKTSEQFNTFEERRELDKTHAEIPELEEKIEELEEEKRCAKDDSSRKAFPIYRGWAVAKGSLTVLRRLRPVEHRKQHPT